MPVRKLSPYIFSKINSLLAAILKSHGVTSFFTRNKKDFEELRLFEVVDPLKSKIPPKTQFLIEELMDES